MSIYMWREYIVPADALYFEANTANSTISLTKTGSPTSVDIETSTDGATWSDYTFGTTVTLSNVGDRLYMRNKSETPTKFSTGTSNYYKFVMSGSIASSGDINYLLCKVNTNELTSGAGYTFYQLFYSCSALTSCPKLSATTLMTYCYYNMFYNCTNLETLPNLPAITLKNWCYYQMFYGCTKIKLSSTQTGEYQTAYRMPTTGTGTTASNALYNMFYSTGGTFTGTPSINTTYYTSNTLV